MQGRNNWYYCPSPDGLSYAIGAVAKSRGVGYIELSSGETIVRLSGINGYDICRAAGWPAENTSPPFLAGYIHNDATNTGAWVSNVGS